MYIYIYNIDIVGIYSQIKCYYHAVTTSSSMLRFIKTYWISLTALIHFEDIAIFRTW